MSDLNERLDQALHAIEPGPAPVEAVMGRGRKIKIRRRAAVLAGSVAAIAAAVVFVPVLANHQALPPPATSHIRVTVNPPEPHAPAGTIASGLIGAQPWNIRIEAPGTKSCSITGTNLGSAECSGGLFRTQTTDPIGMEFGLGGDHADGTVAFFVSLGVVRSDVVSARVALADGTVLTLHPTTVDGARWVAFADPAGVPVDSVTAYSRTGAIATAIPFNGQARAGAPVFGGWLRPGQAAAARFTRTFASGTVDGQAWKFTVDVGPWGTCVSGPDTTACGFPAPSAATFMQGDSPFTTSRTPSPTGPTLVWGTAASNVSYLIVTPQGGTAQRVGVTAVGSGRYFALSLSHAPGPGDRWTAYNSAGQPLASGSF